MAGFYLFRYGYKESEKRSGTEVTMKKGIQIIVLVGAVLFFYYIAGPGCPILYMTGVPCLACGMTRACICLLHFDFTGAFQYHPLCFLLPVVVLVLVLRDKMGKRLFYSCLAGMILVFAAVYLVRLWNPGDTVVKINIQQGMIYRIYDMARIILGK